MADAVVAEKTPILLIHGLSGGAHDYHGLKRYLRMSGRNVALLEYFYKRKYGQASFEELADELASYIRERIGGGKFSVVAFSQGGIIFRMLAKRHPDLRARVRTVVTVCTPHHGSLIAWLWLGKGIKELRPGSKTLRDLASFDDGISYYSVYNPLDPVVIPGTSAKFEWARKNEQVIVPSHFFTFGNGKTLRFIDAILFGSASRTDVE